MANFVANNAKYAAKPGSQGAPAPGSYPSGKQDPAEKRGAAQHSDNERAKELLKPDPHSSAFRGK